MLAIEHKVGRFFRVTSFIVSGDRVGISHERGEPSAVL